MTQRVAALGQKPNSFYIGWQGPYFPRYAADNVWSLEKFQGLHHQHVGVSAQIHQTVLAIHYHAVGGGP